SVRGATVDGGGGGGGGGCCCCVGVCAPTEMTSSAAAAAATATRRDVRRMSAPFLRTVAPIDVRDDALIGSEAHAVASDTARARHGDDERRFSSGTERRVIDRRASARQESAVAVEQENHRVEALDPRACRIPDHAAHDQPIAFALVAERHELE